MLLRGGTVTVGNGEVSTLMGAVDLQQLAVAEDDALLYSLKSAVSPLDDRITRLHNGMLMGDAAHILNQDSYTNSFKNKYK